MLLDLDKIENERTAALDSGGRSLTYGELIRLGDAIRATAFTDVHPHRE